MRRCANQVPKLISPSPRNLIIEHISQRCTEHAMRQSVLLGLAIPREWLFPVRWGRAVARYVCDPVRLAAVPTLAGVHVAGVACITALGDFRTPNPAVKSMVTPRYFCDITHVDFFLRCCARYGRSRACGLGSFSCRGARHPARVEKAQS